MRIRSQLSLLVPPESSPDLEAIRRVVDPVQSRLIPAHVTLCREDELLGFGIPDLRERLAHARPEAITLQFGPPERFAEHGILLPCIGGTDAFQALRTIVLGDQSARPHAPHLTLAHPRNPKAPGNDLSNTAPLRHGLRITFGAVHLIEQVDETPWVVRGTATLPAHPGSAA